MATAPAKAPAPPTVTLKHLAAALAESHEMSKKQAEAVLGDFVGNIVKHLKKGERIRIGGLGILQVRQRPEFAFLMGSAPLLTPATRAGMTTFRCWQAGPTFLLLNVIQETGPSLTTLTGRP